LTPTTARAAIVEPQSRWKEMIARSVLVLAAASFTPAAFANSNISQRLIASEFVLNEPNIQTQIWRDRVPDLLKFQSELRTQVGPSIPLAGEVFSTTFVINGRRFVISALNSDCASTAVENLRQCPARVAEIDGARIRILKDWPAFAVASVRGERGYDASSNAQQKYMTIAAYAPATRRLSFITVIDGEAMVGADSLTIP
jgi:hypothetical protein